jgi:hypothetical protein
MGRDSESHESQTQKRERRCFVQCVDNITLPKKITFLIVHQLTTIYGLTV